MCALFIYPFAKENWTSSSNSEHILHQLWVKCICQTPHCSMNNRGPFQAKQNQHNGRDCFNSFAHLSLGVNHIPLHFSPMACPVVSHLHDVPSVFSQGPRLSNRDCACLRLSQGCKGGILPVIGYPAFHTLLIKGAVWATVYEWIGNHWQ